MANMSEANGSIHLEGSWDDKNILQLMYMLYTQETENYSMQIEDGNFEESLDEFRKQHGVCFFGAGKWQMDNNIESLHLWSNVDEDTWNEINKTIKPEFQISHSEYLKGKQELLKHMYDTDSTIRWEFTDAEGGGAYLATVKSYLSVIKKQEPLSLDPNEIYYDFAYKVIESQTYDYNLKNYCEVIHDGDDEMLFEVCSELLKIIGGKYSQALVETLMDIVALDENWYNIQPYLYLKTIEDIDDINIDLYGALINAIMQAPVC